MRSKTLHRLPRHSPHDNADTSCGAPVSERLERALPPSQTSQTSSSGAERRAGGSAAGGGGCAFLAGDDAPSFADWAALNLLELIVAIWPPPECADVLAAYGALRALRARLLLRPRVAECVRRRAVGRWG